MQGELHLNFSNKEYESLSITEKDCNSDFYIALNASENTSFDTIKEKILILLQLEINKLKISIECANDDFDYIDLLDIQFFDPDEAKEKYEKLSILQKNNIIKNINYISFDGISIDDFFKYIDQIPELKDKKILLPGIYNVENDYHEIFNKINNTDNIYLKLDGNDEYISLKQFKETKNKIDNIVNDIKSMNLSEFEKLIYIYDIVRDREYKIEDKKEKYTESRDLTKVLFGDKIVCVGFSILFKIICRKLNIACEVYKLESTTRNVGHYRNICYIKDKKYNIDGIYFFDPTFDCKKEDNSFLKSYRFFSKTKNFFSKIDKFDKEDIMDEENILKHIDGLYNQGLSYMVYNSNLIDGDFQTTINKFLILNGEETVSYDDFPKFSDKRKEKIKNIIEISINKLNKPISNSKFIKALYEVRKKQYYINSEKYKLSYDELLTIAHNSKFSLRYTEKEKLESYFGIKLNIQAIILREMQNYKSEDEINNEIAQINLIKVLKSS